MAVGREKAIFLSALDCETSQERELYLAQACGEDMPLRRVVNGLLAAHEQSRNVLDEPLEACVRIRDQVHHDAAGIKTEGAPNGSGGGSLTLERSGELIGNYRLMEKIGEGGFGQVYVAEQKQPVRRRVALKLLKPGMDSREVIARFEAERQAVAMMDHPHIACVFDAGTTDAGQPYFVMELVRGVPITDFCERQQLSIRQRLELFVDVCQAVQHAHQRGVIHRDLKPSNIMVTLHDATPVVKVIDFGVAKAIGEPLTQKTIYTRFAQMIGTPMYMSPEQAEMNSLDVDTRSDVYSLGVLLYELLTGTTPFDLRRLHTATFDELRRIIREEEPPRPSVRLSTLAPRESARITEPHSEPKSRANILRRELDWVVMKALEKDRRRRYDTAADVARDVRRYLDQLPVVARPPSRWYRVQKFAQRNKVMFTAASLVILALMAGTGVSIWQAVRATQAYAEAEELRQEAVEFADRLKEANVLLDSARANADERRWNSAWVQYTRATELQPEHYLTWSGRGSLYARLGAWRAAAGDYAKALELGAPSNNPGWWGVPHLLVYAGDNRAYELACATLRRQLDQTEDPASIMMIVRSIALHEPAVEEFVELAQRLEPLVEQAKNLDRPEPPFPGPRPEFPFDPRRPEPPDGPGRMGGEFPRYRRFPAEFQWYAVGLVYYRAGDPSRALEYLRRVVPSDSRFPPARMALPVLAMTYFAAGKVAEAEAALEDAGKTVDEWLTAVEGGGLQQLPFPWFDFLECLIFYREAHELIRHTSPPQEERVDRLEQQALATLRRS